MKKGRPTKRFLIYKLIEEYFRENPYPSNINKITAYISQKSGKKISWNTVKKYLEELVRLDKINKINLPHSKNKEKKGLTLYSYEKVNSI